LKAEPCVAPPQDFFSETLPLKIYARCKLKLTEWLSKYNHSALWLVEALCANGHEEERWRWLWLVGLLAVGQCMFWLVDRIDGCVLWLVGTDWHAKKKSLPWPNVDPVGCHWRWWHWQETKESTATNVSLPWFLFCQHVILSFARHVVFLCEAVEVIMITTECMMLFDGSLVYIWFYQSLQFYWLVRCGCLDLLSYKWQYLQFLWNNWTHSTEVNVNEFSSH